MEVKIVNGTLLSTFSTVGVENQKYLRFMQSGGLKFTFDEWGWAYTPLQSWLQWRFAEDEYASNFNISVNCTPYPPMEW